jgi:HSP90 family molecular chaperone
MFKGTKVLEINPESSIIKELDKLWLQKDKSKEAGILFEDLTKLMFDAG